MLRTRSRLAAVIGALVVSLVHPGAFGHGGVVLEDDLCVINIGYLRGHFKIYLPLSRGHQDYCEDLPDAGEAVFVMEYLHTGLADYPIDFRIIRDVTGLGRYAREEDVAAIADLEAVTVLYRPPSVEPDVFTLTHHFDEPGAFIGIVSARDPRTDKVLTAVFPFEVGFTGVGYWPWLAALLLLVQLHYLFMSGRLPRFKARAPSPASPA